MALIATDLSLCNLAIGKVSGDTIDELGEESPLGVFCADAYPALRETCLGKYRWTFLNRVALLASLEIGVFEPRIAAFKYAKPADLSGAVYAYRQTAEPRGEGSPYVVEADDALWSDQSSLFAEYTADRPEAVWPSWFRNLVVTAFASEVASFCERRTLAATLYAQAWGTPMENGEGGLYAQARNEDARMAPQRQLVGGVDAGPLVNARYGGGSGFNRFGFNGFRLPSQG